MNIDKMNIEERLNNIRLIIEEEKPKELLVITLNNKFQSPEIEKKFFDKIQIIIDEYDK